MRLCVLCFGLVLQLFDGRTEVPEFSLGQSGTLVSVVPVNEGIVIAADSRSTIGNEFCDATYKLLEASGPQPTVVSVPGTGIVFSRPPAGTRNLCEWAKTAKRVMDIEHFSKDWLSNHPGAVTTTLMRQLGNDSLGAMRALVQFSPGAPKAYAGNNFYTIVVTRFNRNANERYLGAVGTRFNPVTLSPEITDAASWTFAKGSRGEVVNFGLFDYVADHVLREGRSFAGEYLSLNPGARTVANISATQAFRALDNLMTAASRTTALVAPVGGGIGGPTDALLLTDDVAPRKLRWK